jgi:uncharacterized integral membrane protein
MSNDLRPTRNAPAGPTAAGPTAADPAPAGPTAAAPPQAGPLPEAPAAAPTPSPKGRLPSTRTGATWFGICAAALLFVVLIIFMMQNTRSVEVNFLGMDGSLPLALALLIAAVGAAILTMVVGTARITQLRRQSRQSRKRS